MEMWNKMTWNWILGDKKHKNQFENEIYWPSHLDENEHPRVTNMHGISIYSVLLLLFQFFSLSFSSFYK